MTAPSLISVATPEHVAEVDMHAGRELAPSEPTLAELAASINSHIEQAIAAGDSHRILAGLELIEARKHVPHGQWESWCAENIDRSYRDVRRLMAIAGSDDPVGALEHERAARRATDRTRRVHPPEPVREIEAAAALPSLGSPSTSIRCSQRR
jgi:hypothetical protein